LFLSLCQRAVVLGDGHKSPLNVGIRCAAWQFQVIAGSIPIFPRSRPSPGFGQCAGSLLRQLRSPATVRPHHASNLPENPELPARSDLPPKSCYLKPADRNLIFAVSNSTCALRRSRQLFRLRRGAMRLLESQGSDGPTPTVQTEAAYQGLKAKQGPSRP